ncbi:ACT domain-containing protein ACR11-like protein, partial [Tanacetum coccineum]
VDVNITTLIRIDDDGPDRSLLSGETTDRPGLLVHLVKIVTDISLAVESGEFYLEVTTIVVSKILNTRFFLLGFGGIYGVQPSLLKFMIFYTGG